MSHHTTVDLAILGGGCAGLSLACALAQGEVKRPVAVIEPRTAYEDDRSWCFWGSASGSTRLPKTAGSALGLVHHRWPSWAVGLAGQDAMARQAPDYSYQYLRSSDFYRMCCEEIQANNHIEMRLGQAVQAVAPVAAGWQITTDTDVFFARQVIDTRPPDRSRSQQATLQQVFLGLEIEFDLPANIDVGTVELMTDMRLVEGEFCFTYILPYTNSRLLVEVTLFARSVPDQSVLRAELNRVLEARGWQHARIVRREYAVLPMGLPYRSALSGEPTRAGINGGALRASSGYGFLRIQRWADQCAQRYLATGEVTGHDSPSVWWHWMDQLFLDVVARDPTLAPELFNRMLTQTEPARFVRFMNDQATLVDCMSIIASMPKRPFLTALSRRMFALAGVGR